MEKMCDFCGSTMILIGSGWVCIEPGCPNVDTIIKEDK